MATAGIFLSLIIYVFFASCINNYFNLAIPDEDLRLRKHYFDFTGIIFYNKSEISQLSIFIYKSTQSHLQKPSLSFYSFCKRTNLSNFKITPKSTLLIFILICGDVHPHPGPSTARRTPKCPCSICKKGIIKTSKSMHCEICKCKSHIKCAKISLDKYEAWLSGTSNFQYLCDSCSLLSLPFNHCESLNSSFECPEQNDPTKFVQFPSVVKEDCFKIFNEKGLHFLHLNARSLLPKISELKLIALKSKAAIISISETWLDDSVTDAEINIENYSVVRLDRSRIGGGVCMFIRNDLAFSLLQDLKIEDMEAIWIEILLPKTKPIIVGTCYRPPKQNDFLDLFERALNKLRPDCEQIILGDFNISFKNSVSSMCKSYKNILNMGNLKQLIKDPTRVTPTSSTIIDHIVCNNEDKISQSGVISSGVSDHYITFCTRKSQKVTTCKQNLVRIRSTKNYNKDVFNDKLNAIDWSSLLLCRNVNEAWEKFRSLFHSVLDNVAPYRDIKIRQQTEPWMTSDILENIRKRDDLLHMYKKTQNKYQYAQFCKIRNKVQRDIKHAKEDFVSGKIEENKKSPKKLWQQLKSLGYSSKKTDVAGIVLNVAGQTCHSLREIANHFNTFFTTVASSLVDTLPPAPGLFDINSNLFKQFYCKVTNNNLELKLTSVNKDFIYKELCNLNSFKSTGLDNIPARFIKDGASALVKPITYLVNLSITSGIVPDELKLARVKPLFKKNSRLEIGNYRPVSILCIISKILEKAVYKQLETHLIDHNLLYQFQSGFRSSYSTDTCLIHLFDHIKKQTSKGLFTGMVMIDLQKAFDTVDHRILCHKLRSMGVQEVKWFESYLTGRKQLVNVNGTESELLNITCGVPQGSILGPLLFLYYVNDMSISIQSDCKLLLYADDSTIIFSHKDPDVISHKLGKELESCSSWLVDNKLSLHLGKTECIIFGPKRKLKKVTNFQIQCNNHIIQSQPKLKYLGIDIDQNLSGEITVNSIIKKVNSRLKFMYRKARCLSTETRKTLTTALIQCHFDYSCSSWYAGVSQTLKNKLQIAQNKTVRFIKELGPRSSVRQPELSSVGFLNIENRVKQLRLGHAHKIYNNKCPTYLKDNFIKVSENHEYNTRSSQFNFVVPKIKGVDSSTFFFNAIKDWNSLPNNIKSIKDHNAFKTVIKQHLKN